MTSININSSQLFPLCMTQGINNIEDIDAKQIDVVKRTIETSIFSEDTQMLLANI